MDSTACLVGADASHVKLAFQLFSVGQSDVEQDHPITRHLKFDLSLVASRFRFFCLCEAGTHPRMRHIGLDRDPRPGDWFRGAIGQLKSNRCYAHSRRFRGNFVLNRNRGWRLDPLGTASDEQSRTPDESYENLMCSCQPTKAQSDYPLLKPLLLNRDDPIRRCRPDFPAHSQAETYGSTFRSPWG